MIKLRNESLNYIDLTRSLRLPHGSLTPGVDHPEPRWPALQSLGEEGRRQARQDGDDFTHSAKLIFVIFLAFFVGCIGYYLLAQ